MQLLGLAQSLGLFFVVCLAFAAMLALAMIALARMERATVPAPHPSRRARSNPSSIRPADRVSSPGSCTYGPRGR